MIIINILHVSIKYTIIILIKIEMKIIIESVITMLVVCPSKLQPPQVFSVASASCVTPVRETTVSVHCPFQCNLVTASVEGVCMCEHVQRGAVKTKGISQQKPREGPYKCHRDVFKRSWENNTACSKHSSAIHLLHYQHAPFKCSGPCWDLHPLRQCLYIKGKLGDIEFQMSL